MGTYVTNTGFDKPTLEELAVFYEGEMKGEFGDDVDLDPSGPAGQFLGLFSKRDADLFDGMQEIYTSRNLYEATGTSLDFIAAEKGLIRIPATPTQVENVKLFGDQGAIIPAGKQSKQVDGELIYSLQSAVTIDIATAREVHLEPDDPEGDAGHIYNLTIAGTPYTYTSISEDTVSLVIDGLIADIDSFGGTASNLDGEFLKLDYPSTDFATTSLTKLSVETRASAGVFVADESGANVLASNTLIIIATPATGWDSVINPDSGDTGRAQETDAQFRIRIAIIFSRGNATDESIKTAILQEVDAVTKAIVVSNRSLITDGDGRPAKSFEAIIAGGADQCIADKIWETQPSGIESYGNTTIGVTDSEGFPHDVLFSRPENRYIHIKVKRDFNTEEVYPADGDTQIKDSIVAWASLPANVDVGMDIIRQRLADPIYSVPGIGDIEITIDDTANPGDSPSLAEQNITISVREIADFDQSRIDVEVLTP